MAHRFKFKRYLQLSLKKIKSFMADLFSTMKEQGKNVIYKHKKFLGHLQFEGHKLVTKLV